MPMLYGSFTIILLTAGLGITALAFLLWGLVSRQFDSLDEQAMLPFDAGDLQYRRPWETRAQQAERQASYGELIAPHRGEWGGAE